LNFQLYVAIREWRTGTRLVAEFSASAYLDVYNGHVGTLENIRINGAAKYHTMMRDVYAQAA
jgi:Domain of unknown function (DUF6532)